MSETYTICEKEILQYKKVKHTFWVGWEVGLAVGAFVGADVGLFVGNFVGAGVGGFEGAGVGWYLHGEKSNNQ